MTRNFAAWVSDHGLKQVAEVDPGLFAIDTEARAIQRLTNARFGRVWRRGKYLCVEIADQVLVLHFRMTGKVVLDQGLSQRIRARFVLSNGTDVVLTDTRRLANAWFRSIESVTGLLSKLGPEPWPRVREGSWWSDRFSGLNGAIKPALMRQDRVAGLGNIAASEICFRARLAPQSPVQRIHQLAWERLSQAVMQFINSVIEQESGPEIRYVNQGGGSGHFLVYGRHGQPCSRCGQTITRLRQSGRSTFWCQHCQPVGG